MTLCKFLVLRQWGEKKNNPLIKLKSEKTTSLCLKFIIITITRQNLTHKKTEGNKIISRGIYFIVKQHCPFMTSNLITELRIAVNFFTKERIPNKAKKKKRKTKLKPLQQVSCQLYLLSLCLSKYWDTQIRKRNAGGQNGRDKIQRC